MKKVKFFRYHRPVDANTGYANSRKGVTMYIVMNYEKRIIKVALSTCNNDNFSKTVAKQIAMDRMKAKVYVKLDMDEFTSSGQCMIDFLTFKLFNAQSPFDGVHTYLQAAVNQLIMPSARDFY